MKKLKRCFVSQILLIVILFILVLIKTSYSLTVPTDIKDAKIIAYVKLNLASSIDLSKFTENFYQAQVQEDYVKWELNGTEMLDKMAWIGYDELEKVYDKNTLNFKFVLDKNGEIWIGIYGSDLGVLSFLSHYSGPKVQPDARFFGYNNTVDALKQWDINKIPVFNAILTMVKELVYKDLISYNSDYLENPEGCSSYPGGFEFQCVEINDFYELPKGIDNKLGQNLIFIYSRLEIWDINTYSRDENLKAIDDVWSPLSDYTAHGEGKRGFTLVYNTKPEKIPFCLKAHSDNGNQAYAKADDFYVEELNWYPGPALYVVNEYPENIELEAKITWSEAHAIFHMVYLGSENDVIWTNVWQDPEGGLSNNQPPIKGSLSPGWSFYNDTEEIEETDSSTCENSYQQGFEDGKEWCRQHPEECGIDLEELCKNYCEQNSQISETTTSSETAETNTSESKNNTSSTSTLGGCTIGTGTSLDLSLIGLILGGTIHLLRGRGRRKNKNS